MDLSKIHPDVQVAFPGFNYREPAPGVVVDMRAPGNKCGHQQRAFTTWWALKLCGPLDLGLDIGSHRGLTPFCIHVDSMYTGDQEHPIYGGRAACDAIADGAALIGRFPRGIFPLIVSNHSLEHMPAAGDAGVVDLLADWISLLRPRVAGSDTPAGVLAMVVPDNASFDVLGSDRDHKHAWSSGNRDFRGRPCASFKERVLDPLLARGGCRLEEYNTFHNRFSFNVVLERTA